MSLGKHPERNHFPEILKYKAPGPPDMGGELPDRTVGAAAELAYIPVKPLDASALYCAGNQHAPADKKARSKDGSEDIISVIGHNTRIHEYIQQHEHQ